jgi:putative glycosyltransferase (TIGR04372 family)
MYINEVGNLSIKEARAIDEIIQKVLKDIQNDLNMAKYNGEMIEQLKTLEQENSLEYYQAQLVLLSESLISKYIHLGHCLTYFGDAFSSTQAYESGLKLDQNNVEILTFIGRNYLHLGRYAEAKAHLLKARILDPLDTMMLFYLSECHRALGEVESAKLCLTNIMSTRLKMFKAEPGSKQLQNKSWNRLKRFSYFTDEAFNRIKLWEEAVSFNHRTGSDLERLKKIANGRPIYISHICGNGNVLSHMVNQIEVFVRHLDLQGIVNPFVVILNPDKFTNEALVKMYDRKVWLIDQRYPHLRKRLTNLREWLLSNKSPIATDIDPNNPRPHEVNYWGPQTKCWIDAPQTLEFTTEEVVQGQNVLSKLGLSDDDNFVCFGVREQNYYNLISRKSRGKEFYWMGDIEDFGEMFRDEELGSVPSTNEIKAMGSRAESLKTPLENYIRMAEELADKGLFVLRMGLAVDNPLPSNINDKIIDYSSKFRREFSDVYLSAKCKFAVAGGTGTQWISSAFGRPVVNTDLYLPNNAYLNTSPDGIPNLSIPRKYWYKEESRFLTYSEVFKVFRRYQYDENCISDGIENRSNTAEEIAAVVMEMNSRIDGKWQETKEDEELQERYRHLHTRKDDAFGSNGLIGTQFLRDNADLIR